ncbi:MAG: SPOR domain-containing protein [Thermodesulfobacteriota bacterium]
MAAKKPGKRPRIRFELTWSGLCGLGVVLFCLCLWMFLLGIWAGQTILVPAGDWREAGRFGLGSVAADLAGREPAKTAARPAATQGTARKPAPDHEEETPAGTSFTLQVGAFREEEHAQQTVAVWRQRGQPVFTERIDTEAGTLKRVYVGLFDDLAAANALALKLSREEHLEATITLLPVTARREP